MNPYCNTADANTSPVPTTFGGAGDDQDLDPVRTPCASGSVGTQREDVCGPLLSSGVQNFRGDLGVVLPITLPRTTWATDAELYPTVQCSGSCMLVAPMKSSLLGPGFKCPMGNLPSGGICFMPFAGASDPRCFSVSPTKCVDSTGKPDGRAYNIPVLVPATSVPPVYRATTTYQFALDLDQISQGIKTFTPLAAYFRIHQRHPGVGNVPDPTDGVSGLCQMREASAQIGCLVDSEPCSIGIAERTAAAFFPGVGTIPRPPVPLKALAIDGIPPFAPGPAPDAPLQGLFTGAASRYPMAHRLYLNQTYGFGAVLGGEAALLECFQSNTIMGAANAANGIVSIPATPSHPTGGPKCLDYPEDHSADVPPANTPGEDNQALGGCGTGLANVNVCP
jgi:hypothetical protein